MKIHKTLFAVAAALTMAPLAGFAADFRSADIHNADDYPTVVAVKPATRVKNNTLTLKNTPLDSEEDMVARVRARATGSSGRRLRRSQPTGAEVGRFATRSTPTVVAGSRRQR